MEYFGEGSLLLLVIQHIGPPVVTIVVGGLFASVLFPRWQERYNRAKSLSDRRVALYEEIADQFGLYISSWRRLMLISELEKMRELSEREDQRKEQILQRRTEARDGLLSAFSRAKLHFSDESEEKIDAFLRWDDENAAKPLAELPEIGEWRRWEDEVIRCLRDELRI